jgi:FkbM family methyltransferase
MTEIINHFGVSIKVDPKVMSEKMVQVLKDKWYEAIEAQKLSTIIQDNETVLEIGAGIGFISTLIAKNPKVSRIVSYEANPLLIGAIEDTLTRNVGKSNGRWEARNGVLKTGRAEGDADFYVHADFWASSLEPFSSAVRVEKVPYHNFNSVIAEIGPSMIVCDIEGGEVELFRNADLTGVKKVFLEVHQNNIGRAGMKALFEMFHARDFHYDQHHSEGSVILFSHIHRDRM